MHDIKFIVENLEDFKKNLSKRKFDVSIIDELVKFNEKRKSLITDVESKRASLKNLAKQIGPIKKSGGDASELMGKVSSIKSELESGDQELSKTENELENIILTIPNMLDESVPEGSDEESNIEIDRWGEPRKFDFPPKNHADLGEQLGLLDFERATKITGARFCVSRGAIARLERSLMNFMLDAHTKVGYEEILPPFIIHERSLYGTGQLPKFKEDLFKLEGQDWYLAPTAEVALTNIKREELFSIKELPYLFCGHTPCFRSEAGSHGKDTRGLIRQHQFNKVELVNIVAAEESEKAHHAMIKRAQFILEELKLPYRSLLLCSGDIGFGARKCIDLEVWLPGQNKYREISSISNCGDFQARRAKIRYRDHDGTPKFAHTLNGSGGATGRTLVAIMENYQNEDGSITVPEVLVPYMGGLTTISKN
jgi:seryl-tRNA synthetase